MWNAQCAMRNKYSDTEKDIHKRIYKFILICFKDVVKKIPKNTENNPIIRQISASLTSIGANDQEADTSGSQKDFIAKYSIVRKEAKETVYWLSLISDLSLLPTVFVDPSIKECKEIFYIITSIIKSAKKSL